MPSILLQLKVQQTDGSLKEIETAYDVDDVAIGNVVQYLNDTTAGLATFDHLMSLSVGHIYHSSDPPYTEAIQATVETAVYITGVEIGSPQKVGVDYAPLVPPHGPSSDCH